jgi:hypothetical protein
MPKRDQGLLQKILLATDDSEEIVQIAVLRALRAVAGDLCVDFLKPYRGNAEEVLASPEVRGELWLPPADRAMAIASELPGREYLLQKVQLKSRNDIISEFVRVAGPEFDKEQADIYDRQGAGNDVVLKIDRMGNLWKPDVLLLFRIYLSLFEAATTERYDWVEFVRPHTRFQMPDFVPGYAGALTTSWQLAWSASRGDFSRVVQDVGRFLTGPSTKRRWAAAQFLEEAAKYRFQKDAPLFGGGTGPTSPEPESEAAHPSDDFEMILKADLKVRPPLSYKKKPSQENKAEADTKPVPVKRYADFIFARDKNNKPGDRIPDTTMLEEDVWYWLLVDVRGKTIGIKQETEEQPIRPVKQDSDVDVLVTAESKDFEIESRVSQFRIPPVGDTTKSAVFRLRPRRLANLHSNPAAIELRFFYRFNLLEHVIVTAQIANAELDGPVAVQHKEQRAIYREYLDIDTFLPRRMNIHISRPPQLNETPVPDIYNFEFTLEGAAGEPVVLLGRSTMTKEVCTDLLTQTRNILENIILLDYLRDPKVSMGTFRDALHKLATVGHTLWLAFFGSDPGSDLNLIGQSLQARPVETAGLIQITMEAVGAEFLYPWALIYDRPVPEQNYKLPYPEGFWGYRYSIEQQLPFLVKNIDAPAEIHGAARMAFMLWDDFPNASDQREFMKKLSGQLAGRLEISDPPVLSKNEFYEAIAKPKDYILYFYTHGYTRQLQSAAKGLNAIPFLTEFRDQYQKESREWQQTDALIHRLVGKEGELDKSYIELSHGRLYYYELLEKIQSLAAQPFVFLNMCESAEFAPQQTENFVSLFLKLGARAVLGTECTMTVSFAHPFSEMFLEEVLRGTPLADALRKTRRHFLDNNNPLGLAYTLFGSGTMKLVPPCLSGPAEPTMELFG